VKDIQVSVEDSSVAVGVDDNLVAGFEMGLHDVSESLLTWVVESAAVDSVGCVDCGCETLSIAVGPVLDCLDSDVVQFEGWGWLGPSLLGKVD